MVLPEPATRRLSPGALRKERVLAALVVATPLLGTLGAALAWPRSTSGPRDLAVLAIMYLWSGFGITVGYHRLFAHRSFEAGTGLRVLLAIAGALALQGPLLRWVAEHRRHHAFSDRDGDPHSPRVPRAGVRGLVRAHVGWLFSADKSRVRRFAPDLLDDPWLAAIDRLYPVWVALTLALPAALGALLHDAASGALSGLIWGGLVRITLVHHVTWSINSLCHWRGARPFATPDASTNQPWLALVSLGESWHNNHHAFPTAARHGLSPWQLDPSGALISLFAKLGLAWDVRRPRART
jgi:stearoyl-CoA desaturase (delta-9 desaturase)